MRRLHLEQALIVVLLFGGYGALYFCRADLSAASPLIVDALGTHGLSHDQAIRHIGRIISLGVLAYAAGKLFLTGLGDYWGGRLSFLIGLSGATLFTALFALGDAVPLFTAAWVGNRLTQSIAWAGLIKISSRWFDYSSYGLILGILSVSYLVGDAAARPCMAALIRHGFGWASCFWLAAAVAAFWWIANTLGLRESRAERGHREAQPHPQNLFAATSAPPKSIGALFGPLLKSPAFLLVCALSFGCTIIRETFNAWTPMYLHDALRYSISDAAASSAIFPGVGAVSVIASGWLSDRLGLHGRALILFAGLAATAAALLVLMSVRAGAGTLAPLLLIGLVAFCLLGPYSYLGGAFALDFGGKQAAAASSGIIDGIGYLGGYLAGDAVAQLSVAFGWQGVFVALAGVSAVAALGAAALLYLSLRGRRARLEPAEAA